MTKKDLETLANNLDTAIQKSLDIYDTELIELLLDIRQSILQVAKETKEMKEQLNGLINSYIIGQVNKDNIH